MNEQDKAIIGIFFVIMALITTFSWLNNELNTQGSSQNSTALNMFLGNWGPTIFVFVLISGIGILLFTILERAR